MGKTGRTVDLMDGYHKSVLLGEIIDSLNVKKGQWYLDCTLGDGGHSLEILKLGGNIVGLDVDPQALERVIKRFGKEGIDKSRFRLILSNFRDLENLELADLKFSGGVFDLGVSSLQLFDSERGFSFAKDGPLDMRMDPSLQVRALDLVNVLSRKELYELFKTLGEEKYSWELAAACVLTRQVKPFTKTSELAEVIVKKVGVTKGKIHPATRVFQALRMAVNDELDALKEGLEQAIDLIEKNGCLNIISFHSLEDRIVKSNFREWEEKGWGRVVTKKPITPKDDEIEKNIRSRSAKLRIFRKT